MAGELSTAQIREAQREIERLRKLYKRPRGLSEQEWEVWLRSQGRTAALVKGYTETVALGAKVRAALEAVYAEVLSGRSVVAARGKIQKILSDELASRNPNAEALIGKVADVAAVTGIPAASIVQKTDLDFLRVVNQVFNDGTRLHPAVPRIGDGMKGLAQEDAKILSVMMKDAARRVVPVEHFREQIEDRLKVSESKAETLARTFYSNTSRTVSVVKAVDLGLEVFRYIGPLDHLTRDFCADLVGQAFTLGDIQNMENGQGVPVLTYCGGYNCRHEWWPVTDPVELEAFQKGAA